MHFIQVCPSFSKIIPLEAHFPALPFQELHRIQVRSTKLTRFNRMKDMPSPWSKSRMALLPRWNLPALPSKKKTLQLTEFQIPSGALPLSTCGLDLSKQRMRREDKSPVNLLGVNPQIGGAKGNKQEGLEVMLPGRELWAGWHQGSCWDKSSEWNVNTEECNLWRKDKGWERRACAIDQGERDSQGNTDGW